MKDAITSSKVLVHLNPAMPNKLAADASRYGVSAVITHTCASSLMVVSNKLHLLHKLSPLQQRTLQAQIEKEALALIFGVRRFHQYFYDWRITLVIDHNLCYSTHVFNTGHLYSRLTHITSNTNQCKTTEMSLGCVTYHCRRDQVESSVSQPYLVCFRVNLYQ